jgi:6-phosphogluconolactonase (cycloisomerase 2 family)
MTVEPTGRYLISVNQAGDQAVHVFRIDPRSGRLTRTAVVPLGDRPVFVHVLSR